MRLNNCRNNSQNGYAVKFDIGLWSRIRPSGRQVKRINGKTRCCISGRSSAVGKTLGQSPLFLRNATRDISNNKEPIGKFNSSRMDEAAEEAVEEAVEEERLIGGHQINAKEMNQSQIETITNLPIGAPSQTTMNSQFDTITCFD